MLQSLRCSHLGALAVLSKWWVCGILLLANTQIMAQGGSCTLACNNQVNVSIGGDCQAEITYDIILEGEENAAICSPNAPSDFSVEVMVTREGGVIPTSPMVDQSHVGDTLFVRVTHLPTGNFCVGSILVINQLLPSEVTCPPNMQVTAGSSTDPQNTGFPADSDCAELNVTYEDVVEDLSMNCGAALATITRTWTLTNPQGTELECVQSIDILRPDVEEVSFPPNLNGVQGATLNCSNYNLDPEVTGIPSFNGTPISLTSGLYGISTTFMDKEIPGCGGSFTVVRTWTVVDPCSGNVVRGDQVIVVKDASPPQIICPSDTIRVSTNSQTDCTADVLIPEAVVTDSCSENITVRLITPDGPFDGNGGILTDVPAGIHDLMYEATDECGNVATCSIVLVVEDRTAPTIIGDDRVTAAINDDGIGIIQPNALIIDAYDNCCAVDLEIKRMEEADTAYRSVLEVGCLDVGQELMIMVRGTDCNGNVNFSMVPVEVISKIPPLLTCPPDVTLHCTEDFTDLERTGQPTVEGLCDATLQVTYEDIVQLDECGQGIVLRTWSVGGTDAEPVTCTQRIALIDTVALEIAYPPEFTTDQCFNPEDIHPDNLPEPFNAPVIQGDGCKMIAMGHTDQILSINDEVCTKILRTWTVIDWCTFDPNDPDSVGYFEGTQLLKIEDITPPEFRCPEDFVYELTDGEIDTLVLPEVTFDECLKEEVQFLVSGDLGPGLVHPNVQPGIYDVTYTLIDVCGNTSSCTFQVTVEQPQTGNTGDVPMANCITGLTISIQPDGLAEIWAEDFDDGSKDDQTAFEDLLWRMGPWIDEFQTVPPEDEEIFYPCADTGIHVIAMWVGDEDGNWDYCQTLLEIIDEDNICDSSENGFTIAGQVESPEGAKVDEIEVQLANSWLPAQMTEEKGNYRFQNVPPGQDYEIQLRGKGSPLNGVDTRDMIAIQKHVLGIREIQSPYLRLAADTDLSGDISTLDLIALQRLILGIDTDFRVAPSWRFVSRYQPMPEVTGNTVPPVEDMWRVPNLNYDMLDADFVAVKMGDVTNDAQYSGKAMETRSVIPEWSVRLDIPKIVGEHPGIYRIPVHAGSQQKLTGLQWRMRLLQNGLNLRSVIPAALTDVHVHQMGNRLSVQWMSVGGTSVAAGEVLFYLEFIHTGTTTATEGPIFLPDESRIAALAIDQHERPYRLNLDWGTDLREGLRVRVSPNPFQAETQLQVDLPKSSTVVLRIWDLSGRLHYEGRQEWSAGSYSWPLRADHLPQPGVYLYQLQADGQWQNGQLIRQ